ncbi:sugar ABC transporter permease [Ktedonobacter sp. SOSP1-52]|uniref:carbohydrate ABC transporter permease n=1 Tax=Ktedonobacter sp. SOSP1-52 TaxID=2778366 RepID=UPI0019157410|nr:carbohydrate ABC transporter permease [Ktedonobacter sp. SOSP1-52]GHO72127.1 sugar ABC transporter permease [Ktedonobacter sp. SOSP1-52]
MSLQPLTGNDTPTLPVREQPRRRFPWAAGEQEGNERGLISSIERRNPLVRAGYAGILLLLLIILFTMLFPVYWLFTSALKGPLEIAQNPPTLWPLHLDWSNFAAVWNAVDWLKAVLVTLILALGSWLLGTFVSATAAFSFSQIRPRFANMLLLLFMCTLMIPNIVLLIPQYANILDVPIFHWNLINTPFAIWFTNAFGAWHIFIYKLFFDQVPQDLVDCARLEGAKQWTIFWRLSLPLIKPAIIVGLIFTFISDWTAFIWPLLTLQGSWWQPVSLILYLDVQTMTLPQQIAGGCIGAIVPFVLVAVFQKQIVKSNAAFAGIKG